MKFGAFLVGLSGPIAKKVLAALGIGVVSYVGVDAALTQMLSTAKGNMALIDPVIGGLLALAGVPDALGMIAGALIASVALIPLKKLDLL